jgi:hypothetical protein
MSNKNNIIFGIVIIIAIFSCSKKTEKISTPKPNIAQCESQLKDVPKVLNQLYKVGVKQDEKLKLEFFYYTSEESSAKKLTHRLDSANYKTNYQIAADDSKMFVVTGWSLPVKMDEKSVKEWSLAMCNLGESFNCDFDGWGTDPTQKR